MDSCELPLLQIFNIGKKFFNETEETLALKDISFEVYKGEFISILGPSGCGKTTLLSIMSSLAKASYGKISINSSKENNIGYMFQKDTLFEWRTILENCYLSLEVKGMLTDESKSYVENHLKEFGLWNFRNKYPKELSGGMRQRVALIRSLATKPDLLFLDEPFSAIDYQTKLKLSQDILDTLKKTGKTAILVTHNIQEAISMSDKVVILSKRPAIVQKIVNIDFEGKREVAQITKEKKYTNYFDEIWQEVMGDGDKLS